MNLGSRIRVRRRALDLTQEDLARHAGVRLNTIGDLERGVSSDPHYSTLSGIAKALDMSLAELIGEPVPAGKVLAYKNDRGQMDTYWRRLPETSNPAECLEYLLEWWRSKQECEAALRGDIPLRHDRLTTEALLMAEEEAIETLLDALVEEREA